MNSRAKGKRGELEAAEFLRRYGVECRRGVQYRGTPDSPDLTGPGLDGWHVEVKRTEELNVYKALDQATTDAAHAVPIVLHRRNGKPWVVIMWAEDWLDKVKADG